LLLEARGGKWELAVSGKFAGKFGLRERSPSKCSL
jgi:hypothetical protein